MKTIVGAISAGALALAAAPAGAESIISEARLGLAAHSLDFNGGDPSPENGVNVSPEILFKSPDFMRYILAPRPYVHGSINSNGDTSYGGAGLAWEQHFWRDKLVAEVDLGMALHDGVRDLPPEGDPDRDRIEAERALLGSRWLFRAAFGVGVKIDDHWRVQGYIEHLSNGSLPGSEKPNQGLDNVGMRVGYRF